MLKYTMIDDIETDNREHLQRFLQNLPNPSYIAGFIDGDGCIFIRKIIDGYQSGFTITQCRTNILQIIRYHFGGSITSSSNRNDKTINLMDEENEYYHKHNIRNQFNLLIRNNEYQRLLDYLVNSFIIKENQYQCLRQFNKHANLTNKNEEKEQLHIICSTLNKKCNLEEIYLSRLNIQYIAGLFDAEGCLFIEKHNFTSYTISLVQKNHPKILHEIINFLGFGKIYKYELRFYKKSNCLNFIKLVKPYLIVKYNQAEAFETFLTTNNNVVKEEMYKICNREKHEIEVFNDLNQNENRKEGLLEYLTLKYLKEQVCKEIHNKQIYRDKSEKMKGEGNHNYGKHFSEETKKKMSISIREAKGGVCDEIIVQVRKMINDGYKNVEIQELLTLPRHTITRIKNGEIICRNEEKKEQNSLTQEQINLSKRKISVDDIILVIEKFIEKWKPTQILDYFIEQNKNNITIDIIKNIKRNLSNRKKNIYESELSKERYEYYLNLQKQFIETII
jgi:hypothetical protein